LQFTVSDLSVQPSGIDLLRQLRTGIHLLARLPLPFRVVRQQLIATSVA
jgi:hypothetical protein